VSTFALKNSGFDSIRSSQWPAEAVEMVLADFDDANHNEGDAAADTVGDRRQEIVFIGPQLGDKTFQAEICENLDKCLVTDSEWAAYKAARDDDNKLEAAFESPLIPRTVTY
jgi:hypothetical protein